ncbi:MAG: hypothetical protein H7A21_06650 [Spirochaetales bacterium]|nr:hypothetical protein [Leptospiraceae bacterium]MCP5481092.1 hypothetical protein [Spirochaetales bacterium]
MASFVIFGSLEGLLSVRDDARIAECLEQGGDESKCLLISEWRPLFVLAAGTVISWLAGIALAVLLYFLHQTRRTIPHLIASAIIVPLHPLVAIGLWLLILRLT